MHKQLVSLCAVVLAGCEHPSPFVPGTYGPDGPFTPPPYAQLTVNPGADLAPAWLPDGRDLVYTAQRLDRDDDDRCLAMLPPADGAITAYACRTTAPDDSTNVFGEAAPSADGQIAYVRASVHLVPFRPISPDAEALVVAPLASPNDVRVLQTIPYTAAPGRIHSGISHVSWLGPTKLVYLGEDVTYPRGCASCPPDTVRAGLDIVTLDFSSATPVRTVVPGTAGATSVAVGATGDTIYYTRAGDGHVFRHVVSSDSTDTVWDFSAIGPAIDVSVRGARLVASVNDDLHFVTLPSGPELIVAELTGLIGFRRPVFSPDGTRVAIEAWLRTGAGNADIWVVDTP